MFRMGLREYRRTPLLLEILVAGPADVIILFSLIVPATETTFQLASGTTVTASLASIVAMFMTPLAGAIVGGFTGLFVIRMARKTDGRLMLAGYRPDQIVLARLLMLGAVGMLVTVVAMIALLLTGSTPVLLGWFALATLLTTLIYGMVGVLAGTMLDTLSGVYLLLFTPMLDILLFQNPLDAETTTFATYLPGNFPVQLAMDAAFTETITVGPLAWSLVWLAGLTALATVAFSRALHATG